MSPTHGHCPATMGPDKAITERDPGQGKNIERAGAEGVGLGMALLVMYIGSKTFMPDLLSFRSGSILSN